MFYFSKGSVNALMKLALFSTSNKVKNHCSRFISFKFNDIVFKIPENLVIVILN